jgi:hypothetical protein
MCVIVYFFFYHFHVNFGSFDATNALHAAGTKFPIRAVFAVSYTLQRRLSNRSVSVDSFFAAKYAAHSVAHYIYMVDCHAICE